MRKYWSSRIQNMVPYVPGEQPKIKNLIKLNTNENPYPPSPKVMEAVAAAATDLRLYPDPEADALRGILAKRYGLAPEEIFMGNGSDEVLAIAFQAFFDPDRTILFPDITYSFYPVFCNLYGIPYRTVPLDDDFTLQPERFCVPNGGVVFANPNAPTGMAISKEMIRVIARENPDAVVLADEAYVDFGAESAVSLVRECPNLLVVQTMSKSRSLAGLRVGWAMGDRNLIEALTCVKNSFNSYPLDRLAQAGAIAALEDDAYDRKTAAKIIATRTIYTIRLRELGFTVLDSSANFLFASHPDKKAQTLLEELRARGILVRWFDLPRIENYLRITVGTDEEMAALCTALGEILEHH